MAIITAPSMADTVYQGPQGNLSVAEGWVQLNGVSYGDKIDLLALPIGMRIYGVNVVSEALGGYLSIQLNGTTLVSSSNYASAVAKYVPIKPYSTTVPGEKLTVVIGSGSGAVRGLLTVSLFYTAVGY
ncbi:TPA: hypothetical protein PXP51_001572 [Yersinia enterocolitica]|nr:hypothetical protein [Yersinia enterocolitica]HEN3478667.1 hypothetical protein [Yersinia enterocolitica]